jgi:hypothetical protein
MNAAQALLREVMRHYDDNGFMCPMSRDLRLAIREELERADTTPTHTEPIHRTDPDTPWKAGPVVGEQTMRRFGLVRDDVVERRRAALNAEIDAADGPAPWCGNPYPHGAHSERPMCDVGFDCPGRP